MTADDDHAMPDQDSYTRAFDYLTTLQEVRLEIKALVLADTETETEGHAGLLSPTERETLTEAVQVLEAFEARYRRLHSDAEEAE